MGELTGSIASGVVLEETESLLLVRLQQGEEEAFAEAFQLYRNLVYHLALKILLDKSEAMDVTQEVFLTLYRKICRFRGDSSLKTWLYRVTLNQAANRNRWWRRRFLQKTVPLGLNLGEDDHPMDWVCERPGSDRQLFSREIQRALQEALKALPFEQRAALVMRELQGLPYQEIAAITGSQVGTVKSRIARGRERLRELLTSYREVGRS